MGRNRHARLSREIAPLVTSVIALLAIAAPADTARGGVVLQDESRGVAYKFAGSTSKGETPRNTFDPFNAEVDDTDTAEGGSARVRATYQSLLSTTLNRASGEFAVDRSGRPAQALSFFAFQFDVRDQPTAVSIALDADYQRTAGDADAQAVNGILQLRRFLGSPTELEDVFEHTFSLGAEGDETESFRRGGAGDTLELPPGDYQFDFRIGLPDEEPDSANWVVDGTPTDRSERLGFDVRVNFADVDGGGGTPVIPLPPAALSGGGLLAAVAAYNWLRAAAQHRRRSARA